MLEEEVYYVNYPYYNIADGMADVSVPVGHAGVLIKDKNGKYTKYEYGVYTGDTVYGTPKDDNMEGNWRSVNLKSSNLNDAALELFNLQGNAAGSLIRMTRVNNADAQAVLDAINKKAYNKDRANYLIAGYGVNNCGSNAVSVINAGLDPYTKGKNKIRSLIQRGITTATAGVPELVTGKGMTSNAALNIVGALFGVPHWAQTANLVLGENTTNDFENRFANNTTYTFNRK